METRRFILALSLSLLVFVGYMRFFAPKPPEKPIVPVATTMQEASQQLPPQTSKPVRTAPLAVNIAPAIKGHNILIESDLVKATVNTAGGVITGWELKNYREADKTPVGLTVMYKKIMGQASMIEKPRKCLVMCSSYPSMTASTARKW